MTLPGPQKPPPAYLVGGFCVSMEAALLQLYGWLLPVTFESTGLK